MLVFLCLLAWVTRVQSTCSGFPNPFLQFDFEEGSGNYLDTILGQVALSRAAGFFRLTGQGSRQAASGRAGGGQAVFFDAPTLGLTSVFASNSSTYNLAWNPPGSVSFWIQADASQLLTGLTTRLFGFDTNHEIGINNGNVPTPTPCPCTAGPYPVLTSAGRIFTELFAGSTGAYDSLPVDLYGQWTFVSASMDNQNPSRKLLFINGRQMLCSTDSVQPATPFFGPFSFGNRIGAAQNEGLQGAMDSVSMYDAALTVPQHLALWACVNPGVPAPAPSCRNFSDTSPSPIPAPNPAPFPAPVPLPLPLPAPAPSPSPDPAPAPAPAPSFVVTTRTTRTSAATPATTASATTAPTTAATAPATSAPETTPTAVAATSDTATSPPPTVAQTSESSAASPPGVPTSAPPPVSAGSPPPAVPTSNSASASEVIEPTTEPSLAAWIYALIAISIVICLLLVVLLLYLFLFRKSKEASPPPTPEIPSPSASVVAGDEAEAHYVNFSDLSQSQSQAAEYVQFSDLQHTNNESDSSI